MGDHITVRQVISTAAVLMTVLISTATLAQNTMFLRNSPIAHLNTEDREILRQTIDEALAAPDGTVLEWSNPNTGSNGRVKVLDTHEEQGLTCRNLRARNEAHGRRADGIYRLCQDEDGAWRFAAAGEPADAARSDAKSQPDSEAE